MSASHAPTDFGRSAHTGVLALTVLVFGLAVAAITWQLRTGLREQILRREAAWLGRARATPDTTRPSPRMAAQMGPAIQARLPPRQQPINVPLERRDTTDESSFRQ